MNEHILRGFKDGMRKHAGLGELAKYVGGHSVIGAGLSAGSEYLDKEDPDYQKAVLRGILKGALTGAAHYGLRKEMELLTQNAMGQTLKDFAAGLAVA